MKRLLLAITFLMVASLLLAACGTKEVEVTKVVTEKETVIQTVVEKETVIETVIEKETVIETVVEKETVMQTVIQKETVMQTVIEKETVMQTVVEEKEVEVVVTATPVPPTAVPEVPTEPQPGGTLSIWLPNGWPDKAWTHTSHWESGWAIGPMVEGLFFNLPDGTQEPLLATGWEVSDDNLVYTVHLREGVKWHDGEPFTADDVVYTFNLGYHPDKMPVPGVRHGSTLSGLVAYTEGEGGDAIQGIEAIDDNTVQFTLDSPDAGFANLFLGGSPSMVPKHILETFDKDALMSGTGDYWTTNPIGTGVFKFVKYETDQYLEFERFADHWSDRPGPDKLFMKIASPEVAIVLLQKGEVDFVNPLQLTEVSRLREDPNVVILEAQNNAQWYGLEHNTYTLDGLWTNPKANQALLYSIDRQAYVDSILQGFGVVRHSFFDGTAYECPTMVEYNYDPEKAEELWNEIGLDREARGEIVIDLMSWLGIKARLDYLPIMQEYLRQMGFKVNVDIIDNALEPEYHDGTGPRGMDWDIHVLLYGPGSDPGTYIAFADPESKANWGYRAWPTPSDQREDAYIWSNPRVNELLPLAREEADPQKRIEIFQELDCIFNEELPALMTASPSLMAARSSRLQGVDWQAWAGLANWTSIYKIENMWLWEQ